MRTDQLLTTIVQYHARNSVTVKLVRKASQWRKIGRQGRRRWWRHDNGLIQLKGGTDRGLYRIFIARCYEACEATRYYICSRDKVTADIVTGDEIWIYCCDPKTKQQSTVGVYREEAKPTKVARERSASKRTIVSFFNKTGHVAIVALENYRTVNSDWNTIICLLKVIDELCKNNRKRRNILHHDNASFHRAKQKIKFLNKKNIEFVSDPAYSRRLASRDSFLFLKIKNQLRGQQFSSPEEYKKDVF
ncbi:Mariner Mos1 transposase [Eumeta japonica]|uniref:Mariner Mos1 transposase n=1 Tax=Eumeta variegata TaxID=151549 RepID=A0A4C1YAM1_EUMVA|nr:Mariner Mos1 transposase [Eumeta japonica]